MRFLEGEGLTFDDVLLVPQMSEVDSRSKVDTTTRLGNIYLSYPIISANMDCVTGVRMASAMEHIGALGILYRGVSVKNTGLAHPIPSIGTKEEDLVVAAQALEFCETICVDVAHGYHKSVAKMCNALRKMGYKNIIAGNIATKEATRFLWDAGVNIMKVGVGPGRVCTTREVTGHGVPQLSAIIECSQWAKLVSPEITIIADGGLNSSGDIVKALAAGAHAVMTGSLFAGCLEAETPGTYRGMASYNAQLARHPENNLQHVEGVTYDLKPTGKSAEQIVKELSAGIRSGMSYSGAWNLAQLREKAVFTRVSSHTQYENATRPF